MTDCYGLNPLESAQAVKYYHEILSPISKFYNVFHVYIYHCLCVVGVLTNISIVVVLVQPSMRKNPFNLFLVLIAVCDMTLMANYLIFKQVEFCSPLNFTYFWSIYTLSYACLSVFIHSASLWLTVNMAILRYLVLRDSKLGSTRFNNYKYATIFIGIGILISFIGSAPNMLKYRVVDRGIQNIPPVCINSKFGYQVGDKVHDWSFKQPKWWDCIWDKFSFWIAGLLLKIIPCLLLTIFMAMLVKMLIEAKDRRSRLTGGNSACTSTVSGNQNVVLTTSGNKSQAERTTIMLVIIVAVFLITELPQGILVVMSSIKPSVKFSMPHLNDFVDLLSLLNSSVNFILYSTMSVMFRREFLRTFGFCFPEPLKKWNSKRKLKANGMSSRGMNSPAQTPSRKPNHRAGVMNTTMTEQMERLIENSEIVKNST